MLFGNGHIEISVGEAFGKLDQAGAFTHGRRDAQQAIVLFRHVAQPVAEDFGIGRIRRRRRFGQAVLARIEGRHAMVSQRVFFGRRVAFAFFGNDVQKARSADGFKILQRRHQHVDVVAVDRADIVKAEFFE